MKPINDFKNDFKEGINVCNGLNIFAAYNANIDYITHIKKLENLAKKFKPKEKEVKRLDTPKDLFSGIMYSMKYGEGMEVRMEEKMEEWLKNNIAVEKKRMGGQVGIMANHLSLLGVKVFVYTPLLSLEQKNLFHKDILFLNHKIKKWEEIGGKDKKKINWIFEYNEGDRFLGIEAKNTSRFIASLRLEDFRMRPVNLNFNFDGAILSGFHSLKRKYKDGTTYKDQIKLGKKMAHEIKDKKKNLHLELAYSQNKAIMKGILKIASLADSMGLDEQELILILNVLNKKKLAEKIHKEHNILDIFNGVKFLSKKSKTKRIHLHGRNYFLSLCKENELNPEKTKKAAEFAAIIAAAYAKYKINSKKDFAKGLEVKKSEKGLEKRREIGEILKASEEEIKSGIFKRKETTIFIPNRTAKLIKDVVGLGDIISSSIFACETGFLNIKKFK